MKPQTESRRRSGGLRFQINRPWGGCFHAARWMAVDTINKLTTVGGVERCDTTRLFLVQQTLRLSARGNEFMARADDKQCDRKFTIKAVKLWTKSINLSIGTSKKLLSHADLRSCSSPAFFNHIFLSFSLGFCTRHQRLDDLVAGFPSPVIFLVPQVFLPDKYTQHLMSTLEQLFIMIFGEEGIRKKIGAVAFSCRFSRWWRFHRDPSNIFSF